MASKASPMTIIQEVQGHPFNPHNAEDLAFIFNERVQERAIGQGSECLGIIQMVDDYKIVKTFDDNLYAIKILCRALGSVSEGSLGLTLRKADTKSLTTIESCLDHWAKDLDGMQKKTALKKAEKLVGSALTFIGSKIPQANKLIKKEENALSLVLKMHQEVSVILRQSMLYKADFTSEVLELEERARLCEKFMAKKMNAKEIEELSELLQEGRILDPQIPIDWNLVETELETLNERISDLTPHARPVVSKDLEGEDDYVEVALEQKQT